MICRSDYNTVRAVNFLHKLQEGIQYASHFTNIIVAGPLSPDRVEFIEEINTATNSNLIEDQAELCRRFSHVTSYDRI